MAELLGPSSARWWLSGGVALDYWLGLNTREHANTDVSTTRADLPQLLRDLPAPYSAWAPTGDGVLPWEEADVDADLQPIRIHDDATGTWVLQVDIEDGTDRAWIYRRDPRLQLPWDRAVINLDGTLTGAPEVQLVWKALRPRPEDDADKDAVLPELSPEASAWWEHAILTIHPHSSWSIHVRGPFAPGKASWNKTKR
ncbi:nucleotidyltransferase domain-containing protein [Paenarthrobacter nitroguajacolicus]|uniref:nucleotidyltransferase domain-containing protein n=1 Tax=Paenarthrobacter nitroguajacolicus TaxID=211146 RepID=UPI003446C4DB